MDKLSTEKDYSEDKLLFQVKLLDLLAFRISSWTAEASEENLPLENDAFPSLTKNHPFLHSESSLICFIFPLHELLHSREFAFK